MPHALQVWGIVAFIFIRVFHNLQADKRESSPHFLFYTNPPHRRCYGNLNLFLIMAIVQCPNCGNGISDQASTCPKCGYNFNSQRVVMNPGLEWYMWVALLCTGWVVSLIYYFVQKDKAPQKAKQALICLWINLGFWFLLGFIEGIIGY